MSFHALAWAVDHCPNLNDTHMIVVMVWLAHCHNHETGQCNPSIAYLAKLSAMSERQVRYKLRELRERRLIQVVEDRQDDGTQLPNHYILIGVPQHVVPDVGGRLHHVQGGLHSMQGDPAQALQGDPAPGCSPNKPESKPEEERKRIARKRATAKVPIPEGWNPSEADKAYAAEKGFSPDQTKALAENFADHHRKKGTEWVDWSAAWHTWVRNEIKFHGPPKQPQKPRGKYDDLWDPAF